MSVIYKLCFYVPSDDAEKVKQAVFQAGAGRIGNYDSCCWETEGIGQFRPLEGSSPHIGTTETVEQVPEKKIELVCTSERIEEVIEALKRVHPYETPAFDVTKLETFD